jgi:hypothetical protein
MVNKPISRTFLSKEFLDAGCRNDKYSEMILGNNKVMTTTIPRFKDGCNIVYSAYTHTAFMP